MTWEPTLTRGTDSAQVGPLRLIVRRNSYTIARTAGRPGNVVDIDAPNEKAARKGAIDAARKLLADWAAELDALEHQEAARD
jgi:hypothetical protein